MGTKTAGKVAAPVVNNALLAPLENNAVTDDANNHFNCKINQLPFAFITVTTPHVSEHNFTLNSVRSPSQLPVHS